ncbi:hypothetical protein B0H14DRAFT_2573245 [Mycena olivaceomarginata]|nr:hypothetical protein B0H14DRAFT_2573245 [Mycena olivaceomarginata]
MVELEALLTSLPNMILEQFRDESFPTKFRTKHPQLFSVTEGGLGSTSGSCSHIMGSESGKKGHTSAVRLSSNIYPRCLFSPAFLHLKEGKLYVATMVKCKCEAVTAMLVPLDEHVFRPSSGTRKGMQGQLELKKNLDKVRKSRPRQGTEVISHCNSFESTNQTGLKLLLCTQVRGMIWVNENKGTHPVRESSQSLRWFLMHIVDPGSLWDTRHTGRMHLRRGMRV